MISCGESDLFQRAINDFTVESGYLIVILVDQAYRIVDYNKGFEFTVRPAGDPRNRPLSTYLSRPDGSEPEVVPGLVEGAPVPHQFRAWRGQELLLHAYPCTDDRILLIGSALGHDDSQTAQRMSRLTTEMGKLVRGLRRANQRVQEIANHDGLTTLANRRYFLERLETAMQHGERHNRPVSMLMADLDHFKQVNDSLGHAAGDTVLRSFAQLLKDGARAGDLPGRLGGEEFAVMLPDTDTEQALQVGGRICLRFAALRPLGAERGFTVSIGAAMQRTDDDTDALLARADQALYQAKASGRNRVVLHASQAIVGADATNSASDAA